LVELTRGLRLDWFDKVGIGDDMSNAAGVDDITLSWGRYHYYYSKIIMP
jgi:hypothetical protein